MRYQIVLFLVAAFLTVSSFAAAKETEKFQKPIKKHLSEIKACPTEAAGKASGQVVVDLEVNERASLQRIKINEAQTTVPDLNVQKCVVDILKKVKYPKAGKGKTVQFSYTAEFK